MSPPRRRTGIGERRGRQSASLSIEFPDIKVTVAPDGASAIVLLTAKGKVTGEKDFYLQELRMRLIKIKRDWLIKQVETTKTLSQVKLAPTI